MNHQQHLERHYDRLFARYAIDDRLAKRREFAGLDVPAVAIYQTSFGRDMLLPRVKSLVEAREGLRHLAMKWLRLADRRKESPEAEADETEQLELFA